jgi:hypothetical protein
LLDKASKRSMLPLRELHPDTTRLAMKGQAPVP